MPTNITSDDVLMYLWILVAIMLVVVLYHVLFIVVDMRKISRRLNDVTEQVETVIMKPIEMTDSILQWVLDQIEKKSKKNKD